MALALALDTKKIEQAGLIQPGWEKEAPNDSIVHKSVVAFVPRDANIKINQWACAVGWKHSEETKRRITKFYRRESLVIYPPVEINSKSEILNPKQIQNSNDQMLKTFLVIEISVIWICFGFRN